jgi:hypothetical protein
MERSQHQGKPVCKRGEKARFMDNPSVRYVSMYNLLYPYLGNLYGIHRWKLFVAVADG